MAFSERRGSVPRCVEKEKGAWLLGDASVQGKRNACDADRASLRSGFGAFVDGSLRLSRPRGKEGSTFSERKAHLVIRAWEGVGAFSRAR